MFVTQYCLVTITYHLHKNNFWLKIIITNWKRLFHTGDIYYLSMALCFPLLSGYKLNILEMLQTFLKLNIKHYNCGWINEVLCLYLKSYYEKVYFNVIKGAISKYSLTKCFRQLNYEYPQ